MTELFIRCFSPVVYLPVPPVLPRHTARSAKGSSSPTLRSNRRLSSVCHFVPVEKDTFNTFLWITRGRWWWWWFTIIAHRTSVISSQKDKNPLRPKHGDDSLTWFFYSSKLVRLYLRAPCLLKKIIKFSNKSDKFMQLYFTLLEHFFQSIYLFYLFIINLFFSFCTN